MIVDTKLTSAAYHANPAVSKSLLDQIAKSPAHARAYLDGVKAEPTKAMDFGTAYHTAILEPDRFAAEYAVFDGDRRTKDGKAQYEALQARNVQIIAAADADAISAMAKAFRHHPIAGPMLAPEGMIEASVFWDDYETQIACRCRPDYWHAKSGLIVDLKTTDDASPAGFARSIAKYRYHVQAAHYLHGTQAARFIFIAQEKTAPYAIGVYELDGAAIERGSELRMRDLQTYASCAEFNIWPGYAEKITTLTLPAWALNGAE